MIPNSLASLGPLFQIAYVARDLDPLVKQWTGMGAGPFFEIGNVTFGYTKYRGASQSVTIQVMLGYWQDLQIEFIRPVDDTPSVYTEWLNAGKTGVHHFGMTVENQDVARQQIAQSGLKIAQESGHVGATPVLYCDPPNANGTLIETICAGPGMLRLFKAIHSAHRAWDGSDPVRPAPDFR